MIHARRIRAQLYHVYLLGIYERSYTMFYLLGVYEGSYTMFYLLGVY